MVKDRICIGKIVAAHGIRGEVKVQSYTQNPKNLDKYGQAENDDASKSFELKVLGVTAKNVRVKIKGVDDRNAAEALIGTQLFIHRDRLPELQEEEFYQTDIVGLKVLLAETNQEVGHVVGFSNFGAGDIIEIKISGQKETEMLPFTKQYVPVINIDEGYVVVSSETMQYDEV